MKPDYTQHIDAILSGESIASQARAAGVHMNVLRRILIKHPDYVKAQSEGKLHQKGYTPVAIDSSTKEAAVAEVLAGSTVASAAAKYSLPVTSLRRLVSKVNPTINLHHRGKSPDEVAALAMKKAERALKRAQDLAAKAKVQP